MKISIFGTGYVGLITAACFSDIGHDVLCVDIDEEKIAKLNSGVIPIYEPGLENLAKRNIEDGRLNFTSDSVKAVGHGEVQIIAVNTDSLEDGSANLSHVFDVANVIAENMSDYKVIVTKSTVPVGTGKTIGELIRSILDQRGAKIDFDMCSNPEFLKEGSAVNDFIKADRIILGVNSDKAFKIMKSCYSPFNRKQDKILRMQIEASEMTKYAANSMLATKISFMNEISQICERVGVDIEDVRNGIGSDSRIGFSFIYPGCGYGGSCFPKDLKALIKLSENKGYDSRLLNAVEDINQTQKNILFKKLSTALDGSLKGKNIAVWGLAFKPGTDDMREAPSINLINSLIAEGSEIIAHDPVAMNECSSMFPEEKYSIRYSQNAIDCLKEADALVICTEWPVFWKVTPKKISELLNNKLVVDGRNIFNPLEMEQAGLEYYGIARGRSINITE